MSEGAEVYWNVPKSPEFDAARVRPFTPAEAPHSHWRDGRSACPYGPECDAPDARYGVV